MKKKLFDRKLLRYKNIYFSTATLKKESRVKIRTFKICRTSGPDVTCSTIRPPLFWSLEYFLWRHRNSQFFIIFYEFGLMGYLSDLQLLTKKGSYCTWRHRTSHSSLFCGSTTWSGPSWTKVEFSERISSKEGLWNKIGDLCLEFIFKHQILPIFIIAFIKSKCIYRG